MRRRVRGVMLIGAVLTCLVHGVAVAQDKPADDMETLRERARADKQAVVASALALTESEGKAFWPVYNAYQSDMIAHYDKLLRLVDRFDKAYDTMTDQTARSTCEVVSTALSPPVRTLRFPVTMLLPVATAVIGPASSRRLR